MVQFLSKRSGDVLTAQPQIGDFSWATNTGMAALDNEDVQVLGKSARLGERSEVDPQWNLRGTANQLSPKAIIMGERFYGVTERGNSKALYKTRQHLEYYKEV